MQHAADYGLKVDGASFDMKAMVARKNKVVALNTGGIDALFKAHGIDVIHGEGTITAPGEIKVGDTLVHATSIIIATGGRPAQLPGLEFNGKTVIGSKEALQLPAQPKSIVIIGAGAIGVEFAYFFNAFGTKVTVVEAMPKLLPMMDGELTVMLRDTLEKRGITIMTGAKVPEGAAEAA